MKRFLIIDIGVWGVVVGGEFLLTCSLFNMAKLFWSSKSACFLMKTASPED
jgi:hypothetical protein